MAVVRTVSMHSPTTTKAYESANFIICNHSAEINSYSGCKHKITKN